MSVRIYIRERGEPGPVFEYGTNRHHSLKLQEDGSLQFYHLQNGDGTGEGGGYEFCCKDGSVPDLSDYHENGIIDIGGERTSVGCAFCAHRKNPDICACCCRNPDREDCFEKSEEAVEEWHRQLLGVLAVAEERGNGEEISQNKKRWTRLGR